MNPDDVWIVSGEEFASFSRTKASACRVARIMGAGFRAYRSKCDGYWYVVRRDGPMDYSYVGSPFSSIR